MRPLSIATLGVGLFLGSLVLGVAVQSCTSTPATADVPDADPYANPLGNCRNGVVQIAACTSDGGAPAEPFSDEACMSLDDAEHRGLLAHDDARAPSIDQPAEGQALAGDAPFTFTWRSGTLARRAPGRAPFAASSDWTRWIELIASAEAHCPPFNGAGYAVVFTQGSVELLRAETASLRYQPTATAWARLRLARGVIDMRVEVARFDNSVVTTGPFDQSAPRRFTITP